MKFPRKPIRWVLFAIAFSGSAYSQISANLGAYSDYVWRGVSQTNEDPAVQAGLDYAQAGGFYIGAWASNVDDPLDVEIDGYLGFSKDSDNGFSWDAGYIYYNYTGDSDANFGEGYFGAGYKAFGAKYSYDFENEDSYVEGALDFRLPNDFGFGFHAGHYQFDLGGNYTDYKLSISKSWIGLDLELALIDTDIDQFAIADGRVVFGIKKTWGGN